MTPQESEERSIEKIEQEIEQQKRRALELQLFGWQQVAHSMLGLLPTAEKEARLGRLGPMKVIARFFKVSQPTGPLIEQIMAEQVMIQQTLNHLPPPQSPVRLVHDVPRPNRGIPPNKPTAPPPTAR